MKKLSILSVVLVLAAIGWRLAGPEAAERVITVQQKASAAPKTVQAAPAEVFQKAFWKRPTVDDHILHAERREWENNHGISKWQWFISVKPSQALLQHLIDDNAFMLTKRESGGTPLPAGAPAWFPKVLTQGEIYTNAPGSFLLIWDKEQSLLHATDGGSGFHVGAAHAPRPIAKGQEPGRLPMTPPPREIQ